MTTPAWLDRPRQDDVPTSSRPSQLSNVAEIAAAAAFSRLRISHRPVSPTTRPRQDRSERSRKSMLFVGARNIKVIVAHRLFAGLHGHVWLTSRPIPVELAESHTSCASAGRRRRRLAVERVSNCLCVVECLPLARKLGVGR